jgi:DNA-binding NarL/FixJ family response regulator
MAAAMFELEEQEDERECAPRRVSTAALEQQQCVLLIEDSEEAMLLVRFALEEYGRGQYRLEWSSTLSDGLERLANGGVDAVLLDLGLPDSSGPESYAWVREIAPNVPVVVLTGDDRAETEFAVTASGVEGYLVKDQISGAHLIEAVRAALYANKKHLKRARALGSPLLPPPFEIG